jgi:hypothetical protein
MKNMKKSLFLWLVAVAAHTYLFYNQVQGYNTTVFSLFLMIVVGMSQRQLLTKPSWWLAGGAQVLAAIAVSWHATGWLQAVYVSSLFVFMGFTHSPQSSLYVAWVNGFCSAMLIGFVSQFSHFKQLLAEWLRPYSGRFLRLKTSLYVMPFSITFGFYLLYSWANPDFWLDFSFFEFDLDFLFISFVLFGLMWLCPLFFPWPDNSIGTTDAKWSNSLVRLRKGKGGVAILGLKHENQQGVVLFWMLNLLITAFLGFNILQLLIPSLQSQPKGYSEQVHEGFNALLISILSAIALIMYYFRGNQNFYQNNTRLLRLVLVWILLNGFLGVFTFFKNTLYVEVFGLTFKRIWVYIALLLTLGGLVLTFFKLKGLKSNMFLLRQNLWLVYLVLVSYGLVDWNRVITWYNFNHAQQLDMKYIQDLGATRLPFLQELIRANDPRVRLYKKDILEEISTWQMVYRQGRDWQSRNWDEEWLKKTLK